MEAPEILTEEPPQHLIWRCTVVGHLQPGRTRNILSETQST